MEDAPQQAIGGHKIALTCRYCNNSCGYSSDIHFINYIKRLDELEYIKGSDRPIKVLYDNDYINGELVIGENKELTLSLLDRKNNPTKLSHFIADTKEGAIIDVQDKSKAFDCHKAQVAILKTAYIMLFAKFGYTFILDRHYDRIREQILFPNKWIVPLIITRQKIDVHDGVYLSNDNRYRGFFIIFSGKYKTDRIHQFCVHIPSPLAQYEYAHHYFKEYKPGTPIHLQKIIGDFINNQTDIIRLREWAYSWKMKF